jgi:hypothetical protein
MTEEKSFSPSSSTSSLYISPIQEQNQQLGKFPSINTIYQLPIKNQNKKNSSIYRTDSFRQAVLSGHRRTNQTIEHISTKRDSFIQRSSDQKDDFESRIYSTIEFIVPPQTINNQNLDKKLNNIYQVIVPPSTPSILTHVV